MRREALNHLRYVAGGHQGCKIAPLHGRVAHDDAGRMSPGDVVEQSLDNAGMRHQAVQAMAGEVVVMHPVGLYHHLCPWVDDRA